jgi:hypothetical protein
MGQGSLQLLVLASCATLAGVVLLAAYAWQERSLRIFAVGALVTLAATAAGSVAGFLFGLPRYSPVLAVPVSEAESPAQSSLTAAAQARAAAGIYTPSNNLEQVSDWLTKLLLGAGLVQLGHIGNWFGGFLDGLASAMTSAPGSVPPIAHAIAGSIIVFYTSYGFLFGYIITTLWYRRRLEALASSDNR